MAKTTLLKLSFLFLFSLVGCVSTGLDIVKQQVPKQLSVTITSDPSEADIYWGKSKHDLVGTVAKTPYTKTVSHKEIESYCYQVKKGGYYDSDIKCRPKDSVNRKIQLASNDAGMLTIRLMPISRKKERMRGIDSSDLSNVEKAFACAARDTKTTSSIPAATAKKEAKRIL